MSKKSAVDDARVVLAVGKESVLTNRVIDGVVTAARKLDPNTVQVDIHSTNEYAAGEVSALMSPSLFGETTVVVVTGIDSAPDDLADILLESAKLTPDHIRLVLCHPGGVKGKKLLDALRKTGATEAACGELKNKDLEAALLAEFRKHDRKATAGAITALVMSIGSNLCELLGAVSQLCSDVEDVMIDENIVAQFYEGVAEVKGYEISELMWNARPVAMLERFRWALAQDTASAVPLVMAISSGLRTLLKYASSPAGMSEVDLASHLGVPVWRIKTLRAQKAKWHPDQLAAATRLLALADRASKGTAYEVGIPGGRSLEQGQAAYEIEKMLLAIRSPQEN